MARRGRAQRAAGDRGRAAIVDVPARDQRHGRARSRADRGR